MAGGGVDLQILVKLGPSIRATSRPTLHGTCSATSPTNLQCRSASSTHTRTIPHSSHIMARGRFSYRYDLSSTSAVLEPLPLDIVLLHIFPLLPLADVKTLSLVSKTWRALLRPILQQHLSPAFFLKDAVVRESDWVKGEPKLRDRLKWPIFTTPPGPRHFFIPLGDRHLIPLHSAHYPVPLGERSFQLRDIRSRILHAMQNTKGFDRTSDLRLTLVVLGGSEFGHDDTELPMNNYITIWRRVKHLHIVGATFDKDIGSLTLGSQTDWLKHHWVNWPHYPTLDHVPELCLPTQYFGYREMDWQKRWRAVHTLKLDGDGRFCAGLNGLQDDFQKFLGSPEGTLRVLALPDSWRCWLTSLWNLASAAGFRWRLKPVDWKPTQQEMMACGGAHRLDDVVKWIMN